MERKRYRNFLPVIVATSVVAGILIGNFYANYFRSNRLSIFSSSNNKINDLLIENPA